MLYILFLEHQRGIAALMLQEKQLSRNRLRE
jgi:hypothetical protein